MVCLTTFGDTKRVISHSLIIFHTFYGYVQSGVSSPEGHPTSHLPSIPFSQLHTSTHTFSFSASLLLIVSGSDITHDTHTCVVHCSRSNHLLLITLESFTFSNCGAARGNLVRSRIHFLQ